MNHNELDVNLGKLVPLEVHGRLENVKITNIYFLMLKWSVLYTIGKLKGISNKLKNMPIKYLVRKIRPREVPGLKAGNSQECPQSVP